MTLRQVEEKILTHLKAQGRRSKVRSSCRYRGPNGLRCAIGCLIDDKHYYAGLECLGATSLEVAHALEASGYPTSRAALEIYRVWQDRHDDPNNWDYTGYIGPTTIISKDNV